MQSPPHHSQPQLQVQQLNSSTTTVITNEIKKKKILTTTTSAATQEFVQAPQTNHTTAAIIQTIDGHHVDLNNLTTKDEAWQTITDGLDASTEYIDQSSQGIFSHIF